MLKLSVVRRLIANEAARRELLWLRAREEGDTEAALDLERIDPGVVERLRASGADVSERVDEGAIERRERFARLWDDCYRRHMLALSQEALEYERSP
jgi:hypothetical protein